MPLQILFPFVVLFLSVQNIGCTPLTEPTTVGISPVTEAAATPVAVASNPPEPAANAEVRVVANNGTPEVIITKAIDAGNTSSSARMAAPEMLKFRCFRCKIIDDDNQQCNETTDCSLHGERCHYNHGLVKVDQEKAAKITIAGCGHAGHADFDVHNHSIRLDKVHHPEIGCSELKVSGDKVLKAQDVRNSTVIFEGNTCTCNTTNCNHAGLLTAPVSSNQVKNNPSSSYRIAAEGKNIALITMVTLLTAMADYNTRYRNTA